MIFLVDNQETGHHKIYQSKLEKIENVRIENNIVNFESIRKNYFLALKQRKKFFLDIEENSEKNSIIHLLYIDSLYKCPGVSRFINKKHRFKYIGTLHWIPDDILNIKLLKSFCKKMNTVIVHSKYLKEKLDKMGIKNAKYIDYPSFIEKRKENENYNLNSKIVVTCLGGTRNDKGLDILMKSFENITDKAKEKIVINIGGIEQDIKYEELEKQAKKYRIKLITKNRLLSDIEYEKEIYRSNVILLPYKRIFKGNSGPMTDGIYANKYILGPDEGNLGYLIKKHNLGCTFKIEDSLDLAKKISELIDKNLNKSHSYAKELTVNRFIEKHKELYKQIEKTNIK